MNKFFMNFIKGEMFLVWVKLPIFLRHLEYLSKALIKLKQNSNKLRKLLIYYKILVISE